MIIWKLIKVPQKSGIAAVATFICNCSAIKLIKNVFYRQPIITSYDFQNAFQLISKPWTFTSCYSARFCSLIYTDLVDIYIDFIISIYNILTV